MQRPTMGLLRDGQQLALPSSILLNIGIYLFSGTRYQQRHRHRNPDFQGSFWTQQVQTALLPIYRHAPRIRPIRVNTTTQ